MNYKTKNSTIKKFLKGLIMIAFLFLLPFVIMYLWNAILPEVLHVSPITYWQALGLFILSRILFGGFGCGGSKHNKMSSHKKSEFKRKFMNMTDEEKATFKQRWKDRCC
ncbi:hypothetical protein [Aequorivita sp. Q41]|uniref:hypothetical protein n=1 Tax=Aequorivita sp. Q41 TaxID=3153300 RepID=UPI003242068E